MIDLRSERLNRGLSVRDAAGRIGVEPQTLSRAESGGSRPHPGNALKIAEFYGCRVTDLWPVEPEPDSKAAA